MMDHPYRPRPPALPPDPAAWIHRAARLLERAFLGGVAALFVVVLVWSAFALTGCAALLGMGAAAAAPEPVLPLVWQHERFGKCIATGARWGGILVTAHGCVHVPDLDAGAEGGAADAAIAVDAVLEGASRSPPDAGAE